MAPSGAGIGPAIHLYVGGVTLLAASDLVAGAIGLVRAPPALGARELAGLALFTGAYFFLERRAVPFRWRGHQTNMSLTEVSVFLGLAFLPLLPLVVCAAGSCLVSELRRRHTPVKMAFNVSQCVLVIGTAVATAALCAAAGIPPVAAAGIGTVAGAFTGDVLVAGLFAHLGREPVLRVYRERFLRSTTVALAHSVPAGVALYALILLHPATVLLAIPLGMLVLRQADLQGRADRELETHRQLAGVSQDLVGTRDLDEIATRVLDAASRVLDAGHVRLHLRGGPEWTRRGEGPDLRAERALTEPLLGRDRTVLGMLIAYPRTGKRAWGDVERELLRIVAGTAAHALEAANVLDEIAAQRDLIARQEKLSALGALMAGVAHEINNPLSFMRLRASSARTRTATLLERPPGPEETRTYARQIGDGLAAIERGLDRLASLSHGLKVAARPGTGDRAPVDLNAIVREVLPLVEAGFKEVSWEVDLTAALPPVYANDAEMHQVLLNLLKNAGEALAEHSDGRVRVETAHEGPDVLVRVADNGPGIPEDRCEDLFKPFFTTKKEGTGLGLSISAQLVAAHGGELLHQAGARGGSVFTLRIPAADTGHGASP